MFNLLTISDGAGPSQPLTLNGGPSDIERCIPICCEQWPGRPTAISALLISANLSHTIDSAQIQGRLSAALSALIGKMFPFTCRRIRTALFQWLSHLLCPPAWSIRAIDGHHCVPVQGVRVCVSASTDRHAYMHAYESIGQPLWR